MKRVCRICGVQESDHHTPDFINVPDSCVCDIGSWDVGDAGIPPVCDKYDGNGRKCRNCEHDKECHKGETK